MKKTEDHSRIFATIAHQKLCGEVMTASFDADNLSTALESVALLLTDWKHDVDDTTVIRIMASSARK